MKAYISVKMRPLPLDACPGIDVVDVDLMSKAAFTLQHLESFIELSFDDLSLRADPPDPHLPPG